MATNPVASNNSIQPENSQKQLDAILTERL
jgi:hypothetical protein